MTFSLQAERNRNGHQGGRADNVPFAEWGISNPSFGGFVTTEGYGQLEFLLVFSHD